MSESWGPRAHPDRCNWPEQDLRRKRLMLERDLIVYPAVFIAALALAWKLYGLDAIVKWAVSVWR